MDLDVFKYKKSQEYKDRRKAFIRYINDVKNAAKLGDAEAQYYLAKEYTYSEYIKPDVMKAIYWMSEAAKNGYPYAKGEELTEDTAIVWTNIAAECNDEKAMKYIDEKYLHLPF